jgi:integrase
MSRRAFCPVYPVKPHRTGQARIKFQGRSLYFGKWGTDESHEKFNQFIAELSANRDRAKEERRQDKAKPALEPEAQGLTVGRLVLMYMEDAQTYYRKNGQPTSEIHVLRLAFKPLVALFGRTLLAADLTPLKLKRVRDEMLRRDWSLNVINNSVARIKRLYRWGTEWGLVPETVTGALLCVRPLEPGRSTARVMPEVEPIPDDELDAIFAALHKTNRRAEAIARLQRLSGARPGELLSMRRAHIDTTDPECWIFSPPSHKTSHRGKKRHIAFDQDAQTVLLPWYAKAGNGRIFRSTGDSRHEGAAYRQCFQRAARRAGIKRPVWPYMIRHTYATAIENNGTMDEARIMLGHRDERTTAVYAKESIKKIKAVARKLAAESRKIG